MPTIYTHGIVGLGAAGVIFPRCWSWLFWILSGFLPMIPDFDAFSPAAYGPIRVADIGFEWPSPWSSLWSVAESFR